MIVIHLPFAEAATDILPSDKEGGIGDLTGDTGATPDLELPEVVDGDPGPARRLAADKGGTAADIGSAALLEKDLSIQTWIKIDVAGQDALGTGILIACASAWQLQIKISTLATREGSVRVGWAAVSQADPDIAGGAWQTFTVPTTYCLLTATRHWASSSSVRMRYYLNARLLGESTSTYGDVDGDAADPVTIGCRETGANYELFCAADVDWIRVADHEMSAEEIRQTYLRLSTHEPDGPLMLRPMLAAGGAYSPDLDSGIQIEITVEGGGLGRAYGKNQELREDYIPDRAWSMVEDHERVCRLAPGGLDTLETRRARITSYLRTAHGYAEADIQKALAPVLDLDESQIEILSYTNRYEDAFTTSFGEWWSEIEPAGAVAISSGAARFTLPMTADARWEARSATAGPTMLRMPIDGSPRDADPSDGVDMQIQVVSTLSSGFANGNYIGLAVYNLADDLLFYGWRKSAGLVRRGWMLYSGGAWGSWTELGTAAPPGYIRMRFDGGSDWTLVYHASDPDDVSSVTAITGITLPTNAGITNMTDVASNLSATTVDVDDARLYMPNGLRVFCWWAWADPGLGGSSDLDGARAIIERMKPADSVGGAVATASGYLECGDPDHGCGEAPVR